MNSKMIHDALRKLFCLPSCAYIPEFRAGTGYATGSERYLDAWVMFCYPSSGLVRIAIEIKISRSDFCREIKAPHKRDSALRLSNQYYFATPRGMIVEKDLPDECGLIEVENETAKISVEAPFRESPLATWPFVASLARRAAEAIEAEADFRRQAIKFDHNLVNE